MEIPRANLIRRDQNGGAKLETSKLQKDFYFSQCFSFCGHFDKETFSLKFKNTVIFLSVFHFESDVVPKFPKMQKPSVIW